jgi:predicted RNase H-like HicB family nuclease
MRYAIVIERASGNLSAYVPDLPACVATGDTEVQAEAQIRKAFESHLEGIREDGVSAADDPALPVAGRGPHTAAGVERGA